MEEKAKDSVLKICSMLRENPTTPVVGSLLSGLSLFQKRPGEQKKKEINVSVSMKLFDSQILVVAVLTI